MRPAWTRPTLVTALTMAAVVVAYAALAWHRRWISDDGLIVTRVARNILAGDGPVFNAFERAEASTSALWPWLLALVAAPTGFALDRLAVGLGGALAVAAVLIAMDGARRLHRGRGSDAALVPVGALIVIALPPFWDFATSGLETGLSFAWLAASWWLLVALRPTTRARAQVGAAIALGLGPLVRPDLALASAVFLVAGALIVRPTRRRGLALAAAAIALPLGYELFRAGYYGVLVPLPALAKNAAGAAWLRGVKYFGDFAVPYLLFVPLAALALVGLGARRRGLLGRPARIVVGAPIIAGLLLALYVIRVGGDFMHARLLLPAAFIALAPVALVPLRRWSAPAIAAVAVWAIAIAAWRGDGADHTIGPKVNDERVGYVRHTHDDHPIDADVFVRADEPGATVAATALRDHRPALITEWGWTIALDPARRAPIAFVAGRLGTGGAVAPLDGIVIDLLGLANPLGAHLTRYGTGGAGHEKQLPWWWTLADFGDPAHDDPSPLGDITPAQIRAARHALTCGDLAELLASTRAPLTWGRFWDNLTGAVGRTLLVVPADPFEAERAFCGP